MSVVWHERREGQVFEVVVKRPEALNAIDFGVMEGLENALTHAEKSRDMRVFALRGHGDRSFVSGGDLKAFAQLHTEHEGAAMASRMLAILARIEALEVFTVAGVNGPAYGGGTETALAFDMRIAAFHAKFGFTQGKFAVPPGWGGLTRMVELVGHSRAMYWLGTQSIVSAQEALDTGLVNEVTLPEAFDTGWDRLLDRLANNDRELIVTLKSGARRALTTDRQASIDAERAPFARHWASEAHHSRVDAFFAGDE